MHEAKTNLSKAIDEIRRTGTSILICKNGEPVAELRPYRRRKDRLPTQKRLRVEFYEDPVLPLRPDDWPESPE